MDDMVPFSSPPFTLALKEWAEAEGVSVNAIVFSVLEEFLKRLKHSE
jgi:hypothetical protein